MIAGVHLDDEWSVGIQAWNGACHQADEIVVRACSGSARALERMRRLFTWSLVSAVLVLVVLHIELADWQEYCLIAHTSWLVR